MTIVQRFGAEINLKKTDGVHWKDGGGTARNKGRKTALPIYPRFRFVGYEGEPHAVINFRA
jgi:hypothetical protein